MKKEHVNLTKEDKTYLENLLQKGQLAAKVYKRSLALLELNRGKTFREVAQTVGRREVTVSTWAQKYKEKGLEFLTDKPRSGRPSEISSLARASIIALACSDPPEGYERWTISLLADRAVELEHIDHISRAEVGRTLKKMNFDLTEKGSGSSQK